MDSPQVPNADKPSPAWLRPVRKRHSPSPHRRTSIPVSHGLEESQSPSVYSSTDADTPPVQNDIFIDPSYDLAHPDQQIQQQLLLQQQQQQLQQSQQQQQYKVEQEDPTIYMGSEFFDINEAASDSPAPTPGPSSSVNGQRGSSLGLGGGSGVNGFNAFGEAASSAMTDDSASNTLFGGMGDMSDFGGLPSAGVGMDGLIPGGAGNENLLVDYLPRQYRLCLATSHKTIADVLSLCSVSVPRQIGVRDPYSPTRRLVRLLGALPRSADVFLLRKRGNQERQLQRL